METNAVLDLIGALFVGITLITQLSRKERSVAIRRLIVLSILTIIWLLSEGIAYLSNGPQNPHGLFYYLNFLSYVMSDVVLIGFFAYCEAFLNEKTTINKWTFRIPIFLSFINVLIIGFYYFGGKIVVYKDGAFVIVGTVPAYVLACYLVLLFIAPVVAFIKRKDVGMRSVVTLALFILPIILSSLLILVTRKDYTVFLGSISVLIIVRQLQSELRESELVESLTFTDYFLSTYVSAYYVDLVKLTYKIYKRTDKLDRKYPVISNYFDSIRDYIEHDVKPEDREELLNLIQPETMKQRLKDNSEFTHLFRDISDGTEKIYRIQVIRGKDENHAAFGFIDVTDEIKEQRKRIKEAEESKKLLDNVAAIYNAAYVVNMSDDSFKQLRLDDSFEGKEEHFDNFSEAREYFFTLVHPLDRERMKRELEYSVIREKLNTNRTYDVEYRTLINNVSIWNEMNVTLVDKDEVALGFVEKDVEITKHHIEDMRYDECFALFVVDTDTKMIKAIKNIGWYEGLQEGLTAPYTEELLRFAEQLDDEPKAFFTKISDIEYALSEFAEDDKRTYAYKSNHGGEEKWVDVTSFVLVRHDDGTPAVITFGFSYVDALATSRQELLKKISEQNAQLELQHTQLEEARNAAEAASRSKTNFLFNMSHDIRTPLNAIMGFTMMAQKYSDSKEKVNEYLKKIDNAGQQLLRLINQVLEMARIESGMIELNEKSINIAEKFRSIVSVFEEQVKSHGLEFNCSLDIGENSYVIADDARIGSIMFNIIGNAMKYTPEGGLIDVSLKELPAKSEGYGTYVFTVKDNGIGMSKDYIETLFEPFSREKNTTASRIQGTGLGMAIVKNLVDAMDGEIKVDSKPGKGTQFDITLNLKLDETNGATNKGSAFSRASFEGRRVLVVEDNEMNREIAKAILEENGFVTEEADDGEVAVSLVKEAAERGDFNYYDVILMDVQMPRMNGYEATKAIREIPFPDQIHIPIIAMTANAFEEDRQNALDAGMDEHIGKPIVLEVMLETIAGFLK